MAKLQLNAEEFGVFRSDLDFTYAEVKMMQFQLASPIISSAFLFPALPLKQVSRH